MGHSDSDSVLGVGQLAFKGGQKTISEHRREHFPITNLLEISL